MTEQHTTTDTTLDPTTFDLTDWIAGGTNHRLRSRVTVYRDAALASEIQRLEERIRTTDATPKGMESMGEDTRDDLQEQKERLLTRIEEAKAEVEVFALIDSELQSIQDDMGGTHQGTNWADDPQWWYRVLSKAATLQGHQLTPDQWARVHETIGAQLNNIIRAYGEAAQADITPRFRR